MHAPLLAAGLDWLEGLLPLLFVLFWIISQIRALFRGVGRAEKPPRPVVIARPPPVPVRPDGGGSRVADEIEEFLRERRRGGKPARPAGPRPQPPQRPQRAAAPRTAARSQASGPALGALERGGSDVARHVHDAFADGMGDATSAAPAGRVAPAHPAAAIAALVRDPVTLRQLFVVREVLERPVERW